MNKSTGNENLPMSSYRGNPSPGAQKQTILYSHNRESHRELGDSTHRVTSVGCVSR